MLLELYGVGMWYVLGTLSAPGKEAREGEKGREREEEESHMFLDSSCNDGPIQQPVAERLMLQSNAAYPRAPIDIPRAHCHSQLLGDSEVMPATAQHLTQWNRCCNTTEEVQRSEEVSFLKGRFKGQSKFKGQIHNTLTFIIHTPSVIRTSDCKIKLCIK